MVATQYRPHFAVKSSRETNSMVEACVASKMTGGAAPASKASFQRLTQRHQRSPGAEAGKAELRMRCDRSLPRERENSQKLRSHNRANCMQVQYRQDRSAEAIPIKSRRRMCSSSIASSRQEHWMAWSNNMRNARREAVENWGLARFLLLHEHKPSWKLRHAHYALRIRRMGGRRARWQFGWSTQDDATPSPRFIALWN